jgi:hypothetical protein
MNENENVETLWQREPNSTMYTDIKPTCEGCGKKYDRVTEVKLTKDSPAHRYCTVKSCLMDAMELLFARNPDVEFLLMRGIVFWKAGSHNNSSNTKKREPVGLSLRYQVLKRDGFQCAICGKSGKDARLEIDHLIPVAAGGLNKMGNLRALCFECNRGKSDTLET